MQCSDVYVMDCSTVHSVSKYNSYRSLWFFTFNIHNVFDIFIHLEGVGGLWQLGIKTSLASAWTGWAWQFHFLINICQGLKVIKRKICWSFWQNTPNLIQRSQDVARFELYHPILKLIIKLNISPYDSSRRKVLKNWIKQYKLKHEKNLSLSLQLI